MYIASIASLSVFLIALLLRVFLLKLLFIHFAEPFNLKSPVLDCLLVGTYFSFLPSKNNHVFLRQNMKG